MPVVNNWRLRPTTLNCWKWSKEIKDLADLESSRTGKHNFPTWSSILGVVTTPTIFQFRGPSQGCNVATGCSCLRSCAKQRKLFFWMCPGFRQYKQTTGLTGLEVGGDWEWEYLEFQALGWDSTTPTVTAVDWTVLVWSAYAMFIKYRQLLQLQKGRRWSPKNKAVMLSRRKTLYNPFDKLCFIFTNTKHQICIPNRLHVSSNGFPLKIRHFLNSRSQLRDLLEG